MDSLSCDAHQGAFTSNLFPRFAALLDACQDYANFSGGRFSLEDFQGIPNAPQDGSLQQVGIERANDSGPFLAAKLRAAPLVRTFAECLLGGDVGLVEEVERCSRISWTESTKNVMKATLTGLSMWPPAPQSQVVEDDDCAYEDVSAPIAIIAQRLYNAEHFSNCDPKEADAINQLRHRARSAFFIVDFAEGIGAPLPGMPETHRSMLDEFAERVKEWELIRHGGANHGESTSSALDALRRAVASRMTPGVPAANVTRSAQNLDSAIRFSPLHVAAVGVVATSVSFARWVAKQQAQRKLGESELAPWAANWLAESQVNPEDGNRIDTPACQAT